jgi:SAM-dependent methyltransferase
LKDFLRRFSNIEYISADKFMDNVDLRVDIMDMHCIQSESFDAFICSHVLEHVENDRIALNELFRILRHGGFGILMVPINLKVVEIDEDPFVKDIAERWRRFGQDDHVRIYSKQGFLQRVRDADFIVNQYGIDFFGKEIFIKNGITPSSILYVVEKK